MDFGNKRGKNLSDPKFSKDAVNLRTAQRFLEDIDSNSITANTLVVSSTTINNIIKLEDVSSQPTAESGVIWFSGGTLYIYSGNSISDLISFY